MIGPLAFMATAPVTAARFRGEEFGLGLLRLDLGLDLPIVDSLRWRTFTQWTSLNGRERYCGCGSGFPKGRSAVAEAATKEICLSQATFRSPPLPKRVSSSTGGMETWRFVAVKRR
ncbi:hypothetical protein HPP92_011902 [Vanilla planifolia]|uniref:Uncharacterized protein n=1 Tax=Vanilla planifolia TaxID=51239 RepID=A0A835UYW6_VANPL|nr:hypothetical protein HPP92_011902 [Vanilla planifolia]